MRLIDIIPDSFLVSPYLMELNILNANEMKEKVAGLSRRVKSEGHRAWFRGALFKELINQSDAMQYVNHSIEQGFGDEGAWLDTYGLSLVKRASKKSPPWLKDELSKGGQVYKARISQRWGKEITSVIRWLNNGIRKSKSVNMNWREAVKKAMEWERKKYREKMRRKREGVIRQGTKIVHKHPDGHHWVELGNVECVWDEGRRQMNCLKDRNNFDGDYYSLRSPEGKSIATLVAHRGVIEDVLMKSNKPLAEKYWSYFIEFADAEDLQLGNDEGVDDGYHEDIADFAESEGYTVVATPGGGYKFFLHHDRDRVLKASTLPVLETASGREWKLRRKLGGRQPTEHFYLFDGNKWVATVDAPQYSVYFKLRNHPKPSKKYALDVLELVYDKTWYTPSGKQMRAMDDDSYDVLGLGEYGIPKGVHRSTLGSEYRNALEKAIKSNRRENNHAID